MKLDDNPMSGKGNTAQEAKLQNINDLYGVSRYEYENGEIHVWDDDGDEVMIHRDGTASWKMDNDGWKKEEIGS